MLPRLLWSPKSTSRWRWGFFLQDLKSFQARFVFFWKENAGGRGFLDTSNKLSQFCYLDPSEMSSTSSDILSSRSHRILPCQLVCKMEGDHQGYSRTIPTRQDIISITFIRHICLDFDIATITIHNPFFRRYVKRSWNEVFIRRLKWLNLKQICCYSLLFFRCFQLPSGHQIFGPWLLGDGGATARDTGHPGSVADKTAKKM